MMQGQHNALCDCSRPATRKLGSAFVCERCFAIDSARQCQEREQRERQRQERRNKLRDEYAPAVEAYRFCGSIAANNP
jgi:hypothetical protein